MKDQNASVGKGRYVSGFLTLSNIRDLVVVALIFIVSIRFATADFNIDLKGFSFTDLVSLFLAISSVALSALFYFKADESARTFHAHTYTFTKDVSEMLGRIDAGFGEKLRSIDQGWIGLNQKLDRYSYDPSLAAARAESSDAKKAEIEEQEARRQDILEDLMQRASVAGEEKRQLLDRLATLSNELEESKLELEKQRNGGESDFESEFKGYVRTFVKHHFPGGMIDGPPAVYQKYFGEIMDNSQFNHGARTYMRKRGFLNGKSLTPAGIEFIKSILQTL